MCCLGVSALTPDGFESFVVEVLVLRQLGTYHGALTLSPQTLDP